MKKLGMLLVLILALVGKGGRSQPAASGSKDSNCYINYPNIPGEVLLENDRLVVQKFVVKPGQWEGIHSHPGNQLYVHLKGGKWAVRYGDEETCPQHPTAP